MIWSAEGRPSATFDITVEGKHTIDRENRTEELEDGRQMRRTAISRQLLLHHAERNVYVPNSRGWDIGGGKEKEKDVPETACGGGASEGESGGEESGWGDFGVENGMMLLLWLTLEVDHVGNDQIEERRKERKKKEGCAREK